VPYTIEMGGKIPSPIRIQVIRLWLDGKSRDKIAEKLRVSAGAVSGVIKDLRRHDPQFDLLREVAVKINSLNLPIQSFAPLVRLYNVLREKDLLKGVTGEESIESMQNRLEALIVDLEVFCFKKEQLSAQDFVSLITNMYNTSDKLGIPLDRFPSHIIKLKDIIGALKKEIDQLDAKKQEALTIYGLTIESLQEYNANKPLVRKIRKLKQQLIDGEKKLSECEREKEDIKQLWSVSERELNEASIGLDLSRIYNIDNSPCLSRIYNIDNSPHLEVKDLKNWILDVYHFPSKYVEIIRQIGIFIIYNTNQRRQA
jgi:transcriptional regulator with XRE-family HTH domain